VKIYFDTNVLVAAALENHPHHIPAEAALRKVHNREIEGWVSAHSVAEFYAVMTRAPLTPPVYPSEAYRFWSVTFSRISQWLALRQTSTGTSCDTAPRQAVPADACTMRSIWPLPAKPIAGRSTFSICGTFANSPPN